LREFPRRAGAESEESLRIGTSQYIAALCANLPRYASPEAAIRYPLWGGLCFS